MSPKKAQGSNQRDGKTYGEIGRQHKSERAQNCQYAREKLGKCHEQAVRECLDIYCDARLRMSPAGWLSRYASRRVRSLAAALIAQIARHFCANSNADCLRRPTGERAYSRGRAVEKECRQYGGGHACLPTTIESIARPASIGAAS